MKLSNEELYTGIFFMQKAIDDTQEKITELLTFVNASMCVARIDDVEAQVMELNKVVKFLRANIVN